MYELRLIFRFSLERKKNTEKAERKREREGENFK